ncbi:hypothetical protein RUM43_004485 [Polyplax serrata]|uniref:SCP domain-containing protein n=1 Tax=Polyplax serrata TaxID=468196 RepID=A0AAN8SC26_POLSC
MVFSCTVDSPTDDDFSNSFDSCVLFAVFHLAKYAQEWAAELARLYRNNRKSFYTQMVWTTTREFGVGLAKSKSSLQLMVANYSPPGNYIGTFRVNCPKPME